MKRYIAGIVLILMFVTFCWSQGTKTFFDAKKSREELEIMKGILGTTLSFVLQNSQPQTASRWRYSNVSAFYLAGQGAVFVIPSSTLRGTGFFITPFASFGDMSQSLAAINDEVAALSARVGEQASTAVAAAFGQSGTRNKSGSSSAGVGSGVGSGIGSGIGSGTTTPPEPLASPAPPAPPAPPQINREELRKKIEDYQAKAKKNREDAEANRQKFLQKLGEVKGFLVETLANYGDSLTTVEPNEYINVVLMTDNLDGDQPSRQEIISVKKSWVTEYKSGKLNMDAFKQKVLQYSE